MDPSKLERMKKAIEELKGSDAFRTEPKHDGDMPLGTHIVLKNLASRNYNIRLDKWEADPKRPALTNHAWAAEIICAPLPF